MAYERARDGTRNYSLGVPEIRKTRTVWTPAQYANMFTTPILIARAPGVGKSLIPTQIHVRKKAGTGWTTAGSGALRVVFNNPATSIPFGQFSQATTTTFFGAAAATWIAEAGKGSTAGLGDTTGDNAIDNNGLYLSLPTANITGGTGNLIVNVYYRLWGIDTP